MPKFLCPRCREELPLRLTGGAVMCANPRCPNGDDFDPETGDNLDGGAGAPDAIPVGQVQPPAPEPALAEPVGAPTSAAEEGNAAVRALKERSEWLKSEIARVFDREMVCRRLAAAHEAEGKKMEAERMEIELAITTLLSHDF